MYATCFAVDIQPDSKSAIAVGTMEACVCVQLILTVVQHPLLMLTYCCVSQLITISLHSNGCLWSADMM